MATKKQELVIDVKADTDQARRDLHALEEVANDLEDAVKIEPEVDSSAIDKLVGKIDELVTELREARDVKIEPQVDSSQVEKLQTEVDQLKQKLKELGDVDSGAMSRPLDDYSTRAKTAKADTDELTGSARGANSALANMIGNSAQDLGALSGIAGSAGVALGQMAEYAADASLGTESLGSSLKSMAGVAGPIAGISIAIAAIAQVMGEANDYADRLNERTDELKDAFAEAGDMASNLATNIREAAEFAFEHDRDTWVENLVEILPFVDEGFTDLIPIMNKAGLGVDFFSEAVASGVEQIAASTDAQSNWNYIISSGTGLLGEWGDALQRALEQGIINEDEYNALIGKTRDEILAARNAEISRQQTMQFTASTIDSLNRALDEEVRKINGVDSAWDILVDDFADGTFNFAESADAANYLTEQLGLTEQQIAEIVKQKLDEKLEADAEAAKSAAEAIVEYRNAMIDAQVKIEELLRSPASMADQIAGLEEEINKVDAIFDGLAFDVDFETSFPEAIEGLRGFTPDLQTLADEWASILSMENTDISIYGNVRADDAEFMEKVSNLRNLFQEGVINEFKQGGEGAAQAFAQAAAQQIADATGMDIEDVYKIMGLPPDGKIRPLIQPTLDEAKTAQVEGILDAIAGTGYADPRIAQIQVALITGEMTPDEAFAATMLVYQDWLGDNPLEITTNADTTQAEEDVDKFTAEKQELPVTAKLDKDVAERGVTSFVNQDRTTNVNLGLVQQLVQGLIVSAFLDSIATKRREAQIIAKSDNAGQISGILDAVAHSRTVHFRVQIDNLSEVERQLDHLARNRNATITVNQRLGGSRPVGAGL